MRRFFSLLNFRNTFVIFIALGVTTAACGQNTQSTQETKVEGAPIHMVTSDFSVAPQLSVDDIKRAAAQGYTLIINNRPDGEGGPDQPTSAELAKAAHNAGIAYKYIPFSAGHITDEVFAQMKTTLDGQDGKTLSFCQSGTRAITIWAMAESALGAISPDATITAAQGAGYNLERHRERLNALANSQTP